MKDWIRKQMYRFLMWALQDYTSVVKYVSGQQQKAIDAHYSQLSHRMDEMYRTLQMLNLTKIGVDHHIKDRQSWAVVCTRDKNGHEHVNFYHFTHNRVDELRSILKAMEREDIIIDTHPDIHKELYW